MRIAFITDPHLSNEKPDGVNVRQNFLNALSFLDVLKPTALVIGGDICYDKADPAVYRWVKELLEQLPFPSYYIAGNHDDSTMLADVFNLTHHLQNGELYYALPLEGQPVLFLDSAKGEFSAEQWAWLREYLTALRDNNVTVFMHHPPLPADVCFMDEHYPFRQSEQFFELVHELPCHVTVICGHYHVEKTVQRGNLLTLVSPSTFYQMKHDTTEFAIDHYRVGVREINFTTHGMSSTVHYV
ncbi:metallophosphoesterase family protein [Spirosoma montaniterrae]|uniref:Metallophosphoesterase n=1 Tax=Spirosoma montaniterrae TaxID=1178516 RepID=A0A1P9WSS1_9BACT|nr:metallophosphoesterase [Spirosoma montaniterrae]AQG78417.1 metallophosphoesterase [Spirosoma montaniterrae]